MSTDYMFKKDEKQMQELPKQADLSIRQEIQTNSVGNDWVTVDNVGATASQIHMVRVAESVSADSFEAKKIVRDVAIYNPITLTKDDLDYHSAADEKRDEAKVADLKTYDLNKLTDWALSNAKVRGAEPSFVKLVENLLNIRALGKDMGTGTSIEALTECRKQFDLAVSSLSSNIDSYFSTHNKFFVFSEKGKLRLELCRVLRTQIAQGLLSDLRRKADEDANARLERLEFEEKHPHPGYELAEEFNEESEKWAKEFKGYNDDNIETLLEFRKIKEVSEFEKKVADKGSIDRRQMKGLFKKKGPGAAQWNEKVVSAIKDYMNTGDESGFDGIVEEMIKEVCAFKFTPEMTEIGYIIKHPEVYFEVERLTQVYGDVDSTTFRDLIPRSFERVRGKHPALTNQYMKMGAVITQLNAFQNKEIGLHHGIMLGRLKHGDKNYNEAAVKDNLDENELREASVNVRTMISDINAESEKLSRLTAHEKRVEKKSEKYYNTLQRDMNSRKYYIDKYKDAYDKRKKVGDIDFQRAIEQCVLLVERDEDGNPLAEDREKAELNENYIHSILNNDVEGCAASCFEYVKYALKNGDVLFEVGTDLEKYAERFKDFQSNFALSFNLMSISQPAKDPFLSFVKSNEAPEAIQKMFKAFDNIEALAAHQNMLINSKLMNFGIKSENGTRVIPQDSSEASTVMWLQNEFDSKLEERRKAFAESKNLPPVSTEEFLKAFRKYLGKPTAEETAVERAKSKINSL